MIFNDTDRIHVNMDYQQIQGDVLTSLIGFCCSVSDTVSLCQGSNIGMTKAEADKAKIEFKEYTGHDYEDFPPEEEMHRVFEDVAESEEELKELVRRDKAARERYEAGFKESREEVAGYVQTILKQYKLIDREVTCITPYTIGGPNVLYYLAIEENLKSRLYQMKDLFEAVITDTELKLHLDDPAFYKEGKIVLVVCSHAQYASLYLSDKQYEEFQVLKIPHKVILNDVKI